jgi:UDP-N-acetylmuramyl pentapeptide synthase
MLEKPTLEFAARACGGQLKGTMVETLFQGVSSDSRRIQPGEIFVALRGEQFDGHDYLQQVAERGAAAAIVSDASRVPESLDLPVIEVGDTLRALQQFAANYRQAMLLRTVAVTGSNGKTSTKDMLATLLAERFCTVKTEGNFNNHIGVPLSLLRIRRSHEVGVFEMGMNHPGELAPLAAMVAPSVSIITNVGPAHLEGMGDEQAVAREKAAAILALPPDGVAVLNADNRWTSFLRRRAVSRVVTAGFAADANVRAGNVQRTADGVEFDLILPPLDSANWPRVVPPRGLVSETPSPVRVKLAAIGDHWISNALLAATAARVFGLTTDEIAAGFAKIALPAMRMQSSEVDGVRWINDAYNANPDSMRAALQALALWPAQGRRVAVLGDMLELGAESERLHRQLGVEVARLKLDLLVAVGPMAGFIAGEARANGMDTGSIVICDAVPQAATALRARVQPDDCVLVKGSRGMKMEPLVPRPAPAGGE